MIFELANDPGSIVRSVNREIERLLGWPRERWLAEPHLWFDLLHPDDRESTEPRGATPSRTGAEFDREHRLRHVDDRWIWVRDVVRPIRDAEGTTCSGAG